MTDQPDTGVQRIDAERLYTPIEAAALIHPTAVTERMVKDAVRAGKVRQTRIGRSMLIRGADLLEWIDQCRAPTKARASSSTARTTARAPRRAPASRDMSGISSGTKTAADANTALALNTAGMLKGLSKTGSSAEPQRSAPPARVIPLR